MIFFKRLTGCPCFTDVVSFEWASFFDDFEAFDFDALLTFFLWGHRLGFQTAEIRNVEIKVGLQLLRLFRAMPRGVLRKVAKPAFPLG